MRSFLKCSRASNDFCFVDGRRDPVQRTICGVSHGNGGAGLSRGTNVGDTLFDPAVGCCVGACAGLSAPTIVALGSGRNGALGALRTGGTLGRGLTRMTLPRGRFFGFGASRKMRLGN